MATPPKASDGIRFVARHPAVGGRRSLTRRFTARRLVTFGSLALMGIAALVTAAGLTTVDTPQEIQLTAAYFEEPSGLLTTPAAQQPTPVEAHELPDGVADSDLNEVRLRQGETGFEDSVGLDLNGDGEIGAEEEVFVMAAVDGLVYGISITLPGEEEPGCTVEFDEIESVGTCMLGAYQYEVGFDPELQLDSFEDEYVLVYITSNTWFASSFQVDADGDASDLELIYYVLSDSDSDGLFDALDLSLDQSFGEICGDEDLYFDGNVQSGECDNDERIYGRYELQEESNASGGDTGLIDLGGNGLDETVLIQLSGLPYAPVQVTLGTHVFNVSFSPSPLFGNGPGVTSTWYTGSLSVTTDGSPSTVPIVMVDSDSDGIFDTLDVNGTSISSGGSVTIGDTSLQFTFGGNPQEFGIEVALATGSSGFSNIGASSDLTAIQRLQIGDEATQAELDQLELVTVPPAPRPPAQGATIRTLDGQPLVADEVVITIDPNYRDHELLAKRIALALNGEVIGAIPLTSTYQIAVKADSVALVDLIVSEIARVPGIESVEPHYLVDRFGVRVPDDALYGRPYADKPFTTSWNFEYINAPRAWDITVGSRDVAVAVVDAEFDVDHADIRPNAVSIYGSKSSAGGHGTHVAGTACAQGNNREGLSGVVWDCALRMYDFGASSAVMAQDAMVAAVNEGARVVNISAQWVDNNKCGTIGTAATKKRVAEVNATIAPAIAFAQRQKKDVLWVIAAGNECRDAQFAAPASLVQKYPDNVIVVGSIDPDGRLSSFSNFGSLVSIAAPGGEILSTLPRVCNPECQQRYELESGTSMAAPHVTGVAALMLSVNRGMSAKQIKSCMLSSATKSVPGHDFDVVDAAGSVRCAGGSSSGATSSTPSANSQAPVTLASNPSSPQGGLSSIPVPSQPAVIGPLPSVCGRAADNPC